MSDMRTESDVNLDDILNQEIKASGADILPGSYGGTLIGFGKPFMLKVSEKFRKPGQPDKRLVFEAIFVVYDKKDALQAIEYLTPVPDRGLTNRKSNVYKLLRALATGTDKMDKDGNWKTGTKLADFIGLPGVLDVQQNEKEWPVVKGVAPAMAGVKYPELKAAQDWYKSQKSDDSDIPF